MNRKQRRRLKEYGKSVPTQNLSEKIFQFNQLPEVCTACHKIFDKQDKGMVSSWKVVVRQEQVRLFCPDCLTKTANVLKTLEEKNDSKQA